MSEFKVIETQEALDEVLKSRLEREKKKYETFTSPEDVQKLKDDHLKELEVLQSEIKALKEKPAELQSTIEELTKQNKAYETDSVKTRIASELGLSMESLKFLKGESEEEIRKSAEDFKTIIDKNSKIIPLASTEAKQKDSVEQAYRGMLSQLKKED